jgi:dihydrofolate reductase
MNELPKVVFSRTLRDASWDTSRIARGELVDEIDALKREPGGDIIAWGGAGFAHALLAAGVIDEYRLVITPVLAGAGLNIFHPFPGPIDLHLASARAFRTGEVLHVYDRPQRRAAGTFS